MAKITFNGTSLEYLERGRGEPVVLVHGSASDYRTWGRQLPSLSTHFRVINYSRRYHWPNPEIAAGTDYSMSQQVDDLRNMIHFLRVSPAHLIGHSYGAFLCLLLASKEPQIAKTLVLAEPPVITLFVSNEPKPLEIVRLFASRPRAALEIIKFGRKGVIPARRAFSRHDLDKGIRIFAKAVFGSAGYDQLPESRKQQVQANLTSVKAELLGAGFLRLDPNNLSNLRTPTLLVNGQKSISLFDLLTDRLEELIPVTERIEISGANHLMHEENAAEYNEAVLGFLSGHSQV